MVYPGGSCGTSVCGWGLLMVLGLWGFCVASVKVNKAKSGNASEIMPQSCTELNKGNNNTTSETKHQ